MTRYQLEHAPFSFDIIETLKDPFPNKEPHVPVCAMKACIKEDIKQCVVCLDKLTPKVLLLWNDLELESTTHFNVPPSKCKMMCMFDGLYASNSFQAHYLHNHMKQMSKQYMVKVNHLVKRLDDMWNSSFKVIILQNLPCAYTNFNFIMAWQVLHHKAN